MVNWLQVTVTSQQRTSFGTGGERAYLTHTHPFLPGSVLRGALAAAWLRTGTTDAKFEQIFEAGRFSPALPAWVDVESQSVGRCKYHQETANGSHAEYVDYAFCSDLDQAGQKLGKCAAREKLKGDYTRKGLVTQVATALEPRKNTAAKSQLFAREMIEKGTEFVGYVVLPDDADTDALTKIDMAFVGGRSSILGRCLVEWEEIDGAPGSEASSHDGAAGAEQVVIRTLSPTILVDNRGLPADDFGAAIKTAVGCAPVAVWAGRVESGLASGWHAASGLPKPAEIAFAPGAVAVLRGVDRSKLDALLDSGLGLRRNEGYGWVEIVTKAWEPRDAEPSRPKSLVSAAKAKRGAADWLDEIELLQLNDAERQWFGNQLRRLRAGQSKAINAVMKTEKVAGQLTPVQLNGDRADIIGVRQLLEEIPDGLRSSIANDIKKGAKP